MALDDLLSQPPAKTSPERKKRGRSIDEALQSTIEMISAGSPIEQDLRAAILRQYVPILSSIPLTQQERSQAALQSQLGSIRARSEIAQAQVYETFATMKQYRNVPMGDFARVLGMNALPEGVAASDTLESYLGAGPVDELLDNSSKLLQASQKLYALTGDPTHAINEMTLVFGNVGAGRDSAQEQALAKSEKDAKALNTFAGAYTAKGASGSDLDKTLGVLKEFAARAGKAVAKANPDMDIAEPGNADNARGLRTAWQAYLNEVAERGGASLPDDIVLTGFLREYGGDFADAFEELRDDSGIARVGQSAEPWLDKNVSADASGVMGVLLDEWAQFSGQTAENVLSEIGVAVKNVDYGPGMGMLDRYRQYVSTAGKQQAPDEGGDDE